MFKPLIAAALIAAFAAPAALAGPAERLGRIDHRLTAAEVREQRLAEALRANLRRRKAGRSGDGAPPSGKPEPDGE